MTPDAPHQSGNDPDVPDWRTLELPDTRADEYDFSRPGHIFRIIRDAFFRQRRRVDVPEDMPGRELIPKYVLQEFHNVPNGNYSKQVSRGYVTGFDRMMLGAMTSARARMAERLKECESVLDAGCAGGKTAAAVSEVGVRDVWGLDPSPYLLQHAARDQPQARFVQGVAEATEFADERFDGIAASFLFHELPPRFALQALDEFRRLLKPGGLLAICEPSPLQIEASVLRCLLNHGPKGFYYAVLARRTFEPFVRGWHKLATQEMFAERGFDCLEDEVGMPLRQILLRKSAPGRA